MRKVYLHIGRGKTGTTTIQHFLAKNRSALLKLGVHYVKADGGAKGIGHQDFGKSFITDLPEYMIAPLKPASARRRIAAEITRAKTDSVLISSENLELAEVCEVRRFFDELPVKCEVKVIFFVRSQDELAESEYNQLVRMRGLTATFGSYLEHDLVGYDFMDVASRWEKYFGKENLVCRIGDFLKRDILSQFLSCIKVPADPALLPRLQKAPNRNESVGFKAVAIARIMNTVEMKHRNRVYHRLWRSLAAHDIPALFFDSDEARAFRDRFSESNAAFTSRFMNETKHDLEGRKFSDQQRDEIRGLIKSMRLDSAGR